ncbi:hypothetical protein TrVE_jg14310 [Triparma verrucosa]|uniref:Uncharacterized protein n=1 Tax=Triparma verrucosa TaxID=1606542 RepID=A0A9W7C006_9STRA|nr:hypothetical protein TrVE_jg14310 [Triparma verrucosa]
MQDESENTPAAEPAASAWIVPPWFHTKEFMRHFIGYLTNDMLMTMRRLCSEWLEILDEVVDEKVESGVMMVVGGNDLSYEEADISVDEAEALRERRALVTQVIFLLNITKVGKDACFYASMLVTVDIPEGITIIGDYSFFDCKSLKEIKFPTSLTSLGRASFSQCSGLEEVDLLHTNVRELGTWAFKGCTSLREMKIPDSLQKFGHCAFFNCYRLVPLGIETYNNNAVVTYLRSIQ